MKRESKNNESCITNSKIGVHSSLAKRENPRSRIKIIDMKNSSELSLSDTCKYNDHRHINPKSKPLNTLSFSSKTTESNTTQNLISQIKSNLCQISMIADLY